MMWSPPVDEVSLLLTEQMTTKVGLRMFPSSRFTERARSSSMMIRRTSELVLGLWI